MNVTQLYNDTCAKCHGVNAEGGGGGTQSLLTVDKFDEKWDKPFFDTTRNGVPTMGMEAYGDTMSDQEIWALVVHIRELQYKAIRPMTAPKYTNGVFQTQYYKYRIETVVDKDQGLKTPWCTAWLPDGTMLVTNRSGYLTVVKGGKVVSRVDNLPASTEIGQGGLMEVAVHPDYAKNGWIYLTVADPKEGNRREAFTRTYRGRLKFDGDKVTWTDQQDIFKVPIDNYNGSGIHYGGKIVFDGKGHIFITQGERGNGPLAQRLDKPNGKIFRLNEDGSIPKDNPFVNTPSAIPAIWTYGHRNPQGLAMDDKGDLYDTEHAPRGGDELNHIVPGTNYGWPVITFGINYNDSSLEVPWPTADQKFKMPITRWLPSSATSGLRVYKGLPFSKWNGDLLAGGLAGKVIDRVRVKNEKVIERETILFNLGRVRDIAIGPDGFVYVTVNEPDIVVRLVPVQ
ncbi:MAG: PQQ-dependent sugar dehydrogenase [Armatimonadetes bacterium]|nr:PQQ-dependent sugar dehydrogenase [Armatimonadota bacterium]